MANLFFYFPLTYRYHTREKKRLLIPFLMTDFLPVFVFGFVLENKLTLQYVFVFILSFFAMFTIYEIGYIINDAITIRNEDKPVLRLTQEELNYFEKKELLIFGVRFVFFIIFSAILLFFVPNKLTIFILSNFILLTTYFFHNYYRNNVRFITNTILNIGKYFIPVVVFDFVFPFSSVISYSVFFTIFRSITYIFEKKTKININIFQILFVLLFLIYLIVLSFFIRLTFFEYFFYGIFSVYKIAVGLLQIKRKQ